MSNRYPRSATVAFLPDNRRQKTLEPPVKPPRPPGDFKFPGPSHRSRPYKEFAKGFMKGFRIPYRTHWLEQATQVAEQAFERSRGPVPAPPPGGYFKCGVTDTVALPNAFGWWPGQCFTVQPKPSTVYHPSVPWYHHVQRNSLIIDRWNSLEAWYYPKAPEKNPVMFPPVLPLEPAPLPLPPFMPDIYRPPGTRQPLPLRPPIRNRPAHPNPWPDVPTRAPEWPTAGHDLGPPTGVPAPLFAEPPPKGTKEKKGQGPGNVRKKLGQILSGYSEAGDLLDALHGALPEKYQKGKTPLQKFMDLYNHADEIDIQKAVENLINNQVSDRYYGDFFKQVQEQFADAGLDLGDLRGLGGDSGIWRY